MPTHGGVCVCPTSSAFQPPLRLLRCSAVWRARGRHNGGRGGQSLAWPLRGGGGVVVRSGVPRTYGHRCFILFLPVILRMRRLLLSLPSPTSLLRHGIVCAV